MLGMHRNNPLALAALLALALIPTFLHAQTPHADWRTIETPHFRVHYPVQSEAWARRAASRLEAVRAAVVAEIGFEPETRTDILVSNPLAESNGETLTLLDDPRIVLYTEPPGPLSEIGEYNEWIELLTVHEMAHLVHLMRPSRSPLERTLEWLLPLDPIALGAPRWVLEGYATVVEGRLTGSGRPSSTIRAAILRKWAEEGRLPSYGQLDSDQRFLGMSMAYLMGSAYLEWLESRGGAGSLHKLWARMTARQRRGFDQAFEGVYGERPQRLYGRFLSEVTASAQAVRKAREGTAREGELWQETTRNSGDPAVSPDGSRIALVARTRERQTLVVWPTAPATEQEEKFAKRIQRMLQRDPEDVAPVRRKPLPREPQHRLVMPDGGDIETPRWLPGGSAILLVHRSVDLEGMWHRDLYRWTPESGALDRVTRLADVSDADPLPDGKRALAVRTRDGFSQLVLVDLASGSVAALTEPTLARVYAHPRISRDGRRVAYIAHGSSSWQLFLRDLVGEGERTVVPPEGANIGDVEWGADGDLYATVFRQGFIDLHRFTEGGVDEEITRTTGGALQPAPSKDGRLFFMSLQPDGYELRVLPASARLPPAPALSASLVPAVPPPAAKALAFAEQPLPAARPYGIGRQEPATRFGGASSPSVNALELGLRSGDVVGRLDLLAMGSIGSIRGGSVAAAWRGLPVELSAHLFRAEERRSGAFDATGGELRAAWQGMWPQHAVSLQSGALSVREDGRTRTLLFLDSALRCHQVTGGASFSQELRLAGESGDGAHHGRAVVAGGARFGGLRLGLQAQRDQGSGRELLLGGVTTSILPDSFMAERLLDPALPYAALAGDRYTGLRGEVSMSGLTGFWQRHDLGSGGRLSLAGISADLTSPPVPLVKLPALDLTVGVARLLAEPSGRRIAGGRTRGWIALKWRP
ncbi:MAG: hypothetical protein JWN02_158 [Acidobacteria bacterium]|nr:hypothetical protein [Acidobacteriota bacterium]